MVFYPLFRRYLLRRLRLLLPIVVPIVLAVHYRSERIVFGGILTERNHVSGGGLVHGVLEAMRVREGGAAKREFLGLPVHELDELHSEWGCILFGQIQAFERLNRLSTGPDHVPEDLRQQMGGIVSRGKHGPVEKIPCADPDPRFQLGAGPDQLGCLFSHSHQQIYMIGQIPLEISRASKISIARSVVMTLVRLAISRWVFSLKPMWRPECESYRHQLVLVMSALDGEYSASQRRRTWPS